jgi:hypothetical protein
MVHKQSTSTIEYNLTSAGHLHNVHNGKRLTVCSKAEGRHAYQNMYAGCGCSCAWTSPGSYADVYRYASVKAEVCGHDDAMGTEAYVGACA